MHDKAEPRANDTEIVPISDLERVLGGNRALRRKFLSNLRRRVKQAKKEESRKPNID